ncbi:hypothetical protein [Streptosporangium sp. NPDC000396]|uniref:hypothetical protein n=1 Tax=Streptosporangium sp. NPDC000396 TaxID=3366185 RepID=UPI0036A7CFFE
MVVTSRRDAWAVGNGESGPTVKRWNGIGWRDVTIPAGPEFPMAVSASSSRDVWVFGTDGRVWRWNGRTWSRQGGPTGSDESAAAVVAGAGEAWLAGVEDVAYINRWSRERWTRAALPFKVDIQALSAVSPNDVWAMGDSAVLHWDGTNFRAIPLPPPYAIRSSEADGTYLRLLDVAAVSPGEVWVVGTMGKDSSAGVAFRWDGHRFTSLALPEGTAELTAVEGDGHGGFWTAGGVGRDRWDTRLQILHNDGRHWTQEPTPERTGTWGHVVSDFARLPGDDRMIAVGGEPAQEEDSWQYPRTVEIFDVVIFGFL